MLLFMLLAIIKVTKTDSGFRNFNDTTVYILPSEPSISCPSVHCYSIDEWLQQGQFPSDLTVILLFGVHELGPQQESVIISDVYSFRLIGEKSGNGSNSVVTCSKNDLFNFINIQLLEISNITFISCFKIRKYVLKSDTYDDDEEKSLQISTTFIILNSANISIDSVSLLEGGIVIMEKAPQYSITNNSSIMLLNLYIAQQGVGLFITADYISVKSVRIIIASAVFSMSCIYIHTKKHYSITMEEVSLEESVCKNEVPSVFISNINNTLFKNFTIHDSKYPPLLIENVIAQVDIQGYWRFHNNEGGVTLTSKLVVHEGSKINFVNNSAKFGASLFDLGSTLKTYGKDIIINGGSVYFKDNTVDYGALFIVRFAEHFVLRSSVITFKNNLSGTKIETSKGIDFSQASILLLTQVYFYASSSNLSFVNNQAQLSG